MELIFATHNLNKVIEIQNALGAAFKVISLVDLNENQIPESGTTIQENSHLKASYIYHKYHLPCFADDTGLEVFSLNNEPGVHYARYAGTGASEDNIDLLLTNLSDHEDRGAQFKTILTFYDDQSNCHFFEGIVQGNILSSRMGVGGFGYDPIFQPVGFEKTFSQMSLEEKNKISHRGIAITKLLNHIRSK